MKNFRKTHLLILTFGLLIFTACNKDEETGNPEAEPVTHSCKLIKEIGYYTSNPNKIIAYKEYTYNSNNLLERISMVENDSQSIRSITYIYNAQGKPSAALYHRADTSVVTGKEIYTYNAANLLTRIDFTGDGGYTYYFAPDHVVMHYDISGQRIRTDFYTAAQPNVIDHFIEYNTYSAGGITGVEYFNNTNPPTFKQNIEIKFDNKISLKSGLGYLDGLFPDLEKHNLIEHREWGPGFEDIHGMVYKYDTLGLPVKGYSYGGTQLGDGGGFETKYQYDCQ